MKRMRGDVDTTVMPDYNWMIGADTASPDGYIIRARVKRDQYKNYDGCIDDLNIAVSCFADTDYLHRGDYTSLVGDVWRQAGQPTKAVISYKAAIKYYNKMLKRHPDQIFAIYGKAVDQQKLKLYKPAVINLETALKYAPKNAIIYERLAQLQDIVGDHDKAVANADSAVKLNRDRKVGFFYKGYYHYATKQYKAALDDFYMSMSTTPKLYDASYYGGLAQLNMHNKQAACSIWFDAQSNGYIDADSLVHANCK
ncbi:MAG: tetratricopeptide repeat protein [Mucilaginibacter sp.]